MVSENIYLVFFFIIDFILTLIPTFEFDISAVNLDYLGEYVGYVLFLFPVLPLLPLVGMALTLDIATASVAVILRLKSIIPTWGN
jgi:predicted membrane-bound spermidine synthase